MLQGINVYTHGEMLPGHGYPELHKYPHLVGNYGGAWYRQRRDFAEFPGPILMTTNCVVDPPASYAGELCSLHCVSSGVEQRCSVGQLGQFLSFRNREVCTPSGLNRPLPF